MDGDLGAMPTTMGIRKVRMGVPNARGAWKRMGVPLVFVVVMLMHVCQSLMPVLVSMMFRQV